MTCLSLESFIIFTLWFHSKELPIYKINRENQSIPCQEQREQEDSKLKKASFSDVQWIFSIEVQFVLFCSSMDDSLKHFLFSLPV